MDNLGKDRSGLRLRPAGVVGRFFLISTLAGLLIGLFEAHLLWTTPRVIPLLVPSVGWVIWFLAPLVDMIFFGLVGLVLGWLGSRTPQKEVPVALAVGIAATFVTLMLKWFHLVIALHPFHFDMEFVMPVAYLAAGFVVSLLFLAVVWQRLAGIVGGWMVRLMKLLAWGLAVAVVAGFVGIGTFVEWPSISSTMVQAAQPPTGDPNIVFIVMDTVRADHLSAYGYSRPTTPNLERFAKTGVLFENAIAASSWTLASHASMFTGLLPQQHGADWAVPLASGPSTIAAVLRSQGYQTAGFVANQLYMQRGWGIAQGMGYYQDDRDVLRHNLAETLLGSALVQPIYRHFWQYNYFDRESAGQLDKRVFRWFRHRSQRPYYLFINYFDAHSPYYPPSPYNHRFGVLPSAVARELKAFSRGDDRKAHFSLQGRKALIAGYDNSLAYLDVQMGRLLRFLCQSPQWKNTIVVITSDHGEEFGWHGSYGHGRNLFRGVIHVPLIIAGPGIPRGLRVGHIVGTRELFSTILDLAGRSKAPFSRTSLAKFWNPSFNPTATDDVVSEVVPQDDLTAQGAMMSLTTPQWQYIVHHSGRQELYNWIKDSQEKDNLAASQQNQAVLKRLRSRLIDLVGNATGPWRGMPYLGALANVPGASRVSFLRAHPDTSGNIPRIGSAQALFGTTEPVSSQPSRPEREVLKSLPYQ